MIDLMVLLALAALSGWLISLVKGSAAISHRVTSPGMLLAMVPWQEGGIIGLLAFFTLMAGWLIVRRVRSRKSDAEPQWSATDLDEPVQLRSDDLQRILSAVIAGTCIASEHVRKAQGDLSVEDYGDKLRAAESELEQVIKCLGEVIRHLNLEAAGGVR